MKYETQSVPNGTSPVDSGDRAPLPWAIDAAQEFCRAHVDAVHYELAWPVLANLLQVVDDSRLRVPGRGTPAEMKHPPPAVGGPLGPKEVAPPSDLGADWVLLLHACIEHAQKLGATDPQIYFESEAGLVVLDGEHHSGNSAYPRHDNVLFVLPWPLAVKRDVGSW